MRITHLALNTLQKGEIFQKFFPSSSGFTAKSIYGPEGSLRSLWNQSWNSVDEMRSDLCQNMGGGVPMAIIEELVRICSARN